MLNSVLVIMWSMLKIPIIVYGSFLILFFHQLYFCFNFYSFFQKLTNEQLRNIFDHVQALRLFLNLLRSGIRNDCKLKISTTKKSCEQDQDKRVNEFSICIF